MAPTCKWLSTGTAISTFRELMMAPIKTTLTETIFQKTALSRDHPPVIDLKRDEFHANLETAQAKSGSKKRKDIDL